MSPICEAALLYLAARSLEREIVELEREIVERTLNRYSSSSPDYHLQRKAIRASLAEAAAVTRFFRQRLAPAMFDYVGIHGGSVDSEEEMG